MNVLQHCKFVAAIKPGLIVNNNTVTATEVDARGYDYATFVVTLGVTDIAMTALKVQAASSTGGDFQDITGATFSAGSGFGGATLALPSATDDGQVCVFHIDLRGKERFLKLVATFGNGSSGGYASASCILSKARVAPTTSTGMADGDVCLVV